MKTGENETSAKRWAVPPCSGGGWRRAALEAGGWRLGWLVACSSRQLAAAGFFQEEACAGSGELSGAEVI